MSVDLVWKTRGGTWRCPRSTSSTCGRSSRTLSGPVPSVSARLRCGRRGGAGLGWWHDGAASAGRDVAHGATTRGEVAATEVVSAVAQCRAVRLRLEGDAKARVPWGVGGAERGIRGFDGPYGAAVVRALGADGVRSAAAAACDVRDRQRASSAAARDFQGAVGPGGVLASAGAARCARLRGAGPGQDARLRALARPLHPDAPVAADGGTGRTPNAGGRWVAVAAWMRRSGADCW